jgi:hypothetical protein
MRIYFFVFLVFVSCSVNSNDDGSSTVSSESVTSFNWSKGEVEVMTKKSNRFSFECKLSILDYSNGNWYIPGLKRKSLHFSVEHLSIKETDRVYFPEIVTTLFFKLLSETLEKYDDLEEIYLHVSDDAIPSYLKNEFMQRVISEIKKENGSPPWDFDGEPPYIVAHIKRELQWANRIQDIVSGKILYAGITADDENLYFDSRYFGMPYSKLVLLPNCGFKPNMLSFSLCYSHGPFFKARLKFLQLEQERERLLREME